MFKRGPAGDDVNSRKSLFEVPIIDLKKIYNNFMAALYQSDQYHRKPWKAANSTEMSDKWRVLVDPVIKANPVIWTIL